MRRARLIPRYKARRLQRERTLPKVFTVEVNFATGVSPDALAEVRADTFRAIREQVQAAIAAGKRNG
jgi:hypothetical protein